jgi:uncharacterized protein with GYD domain
LKEFVMPTYIMLTKLDPQAVSEPASIAKLNQAVEDHVRRECPGVIWVANYATSGPFDYVDIFEASDQEEAAKVSLLVRSHGHATVETWMATPWDRFVDIARSVSGPEAETARPAEGAYARVNLKGPTAD